MAFIEKSKHQKAETATKSGVKKRERRAIGTA